MNPMISLYKVIDLENLKAQKQKELNALEIKAEKAANELDIFIEKTEKAQAKFKTTKEKEQFIAQNARHYDDNPEYELLEPQPLIYAKTYREKYALPLVNKLKNVIHRLLLQYFDKTHALQTKLDRAYDETKKPYKKNRKIRTGK